MHHSTDLVHWRDGGAMVPEAPHYSPLKQVWAPHVIRHSPGRYIMYFAVDFIPSGGCWKPDYPINGKPTCFGIGAAVASSPKGPFVSHGNGPIIGGQGLDVLDPFVAAVGSQWTLYYGSGSNGIHSVHLQSDGLSQAPHAKPELAVAVEPKNFDQSLIEGAWLGEHNGSDTA
jgi:beta-xylosidase